MSENWKKNDTSDPRYKRNVLIVASVTLTLGLIAASILAAKINAAEAANAASIEQLKAEKAATP
ncbi:MAG: hypothetical protein R3E66_00655 [bacterium]